MVTCSPDRQKVNEQEGEPWGFHTVEATVDDVRRWAWDRKIPVHTTGHPPKAVILAYNRVHPDKALSIPTRYRNTLSDLRRKSDRRVAQEREHA